MAGQSQPLPHAIVHAYHNVSVQVEEGLRQYTERQRFSNGTDLCRRIEQFVDALRHIPGAYEELLRRTDWVETGCGPGSAYHQARAAALAAYKGRPEQLSGSKVAIGRLRHTRGQPCHLEDLDCERQDIERILAEGILKLTISARTAFSDWRTACREVQREAQPIHVDGCWFLFHVHQSGEHNASKHAELAKATMKLDFGGAWLEEIKAAVDSLIDWCTLGIVAAGTEQTADCPPPQVLAESASESPVAASRRQKRSTTRGDAREKIIGALTKHHEFADGSCMNQDPIGCNVLAKTAQVSSSTASDFIKKQFGSHTKYIAICSDLGALIVALKLLNQEYTPALLYGAVPPGDREREN